MSVKFRYPRIVLLIALFATGFLCAKEMIRTPPDFPVLGELEPVLEQVMLKDGGPDESLATVADKPAVAALIEKHQMKLFGGPMVGAVSHNAAKIWLRTAGPANVDIELVGKTFTAKTTADTDFTTVVDLTGLTPNTAQDYVVLINNEDTASGTFRTAAKPGEGEVLKVAFGGGARYNPPKERIWSTIAKRKPDAFLWLGDNLYQDKPESRSLQRLYYYRRQLRPEFQTLTSSCANYAIWDDHDFGKNDTAGGPDKFKPAWKLPVWKVFKENWPNPAFGGGAEQPGCWFNWRQGDVEFFMTDGRYYRDFKVGKTMLGPVQKAWLKEQLAASTAPFKVLCSGTLWTEHADKGGKDSWWGVPEERDEIFDWIQSEKINGVILASADRHRTDIYQIKRPGGYDLYEFETSKLTNNHTHNTRDKALFSYNKGNFYGLLSFDTTVEDPTVTFECITIDDEVVHTFQLKHSQLRMPAK